MKLKPINNKEPSTIKEIKEAINNGEIPPLSEQEKESIIKTMKQNNGEVKLKETKDMTNEELVKLEKDCLDTLEYIEKNKNSFGIMYETALSTTRKIQQEVEKEKQKRGVKNEKRKNL